MIKFFTLSLLLLCLIEISGQNKIELQIGGANYAGLTLNTEYEIPIVTSGEHTLSPSFGIGFTAPHWKENQIIIHAGVNYKYKNIGIGTEISGFTSNPFWGQQPEYLDKFNVYPNLNYTIPLHTKFYMKLSAGVNIIYVKTKSFEPIEYRIREASELFSCGISVGYRFH